MLAVNVMTYTLDPHEGYGRYGVHLIRALHRAGVDVYPAQLSELSIPSWMLQMKGLTFSRTTIQLTRALEFEPVPGRLWGYTMFEAERVPQGWVDQINALCDRLLVPCAHNKQAFIKSGVTVPVSVVHGGTDPAEFPMRHFNPRVKSPYTFMALADRGMRKGPDLVLTAFERAFAGVEDVRLILKARKNSQHAGLTFTDYRISLWCDDVPSAADVYAQADVFVFPSRGEGWGMPPREAAMSGVPVIVSRYQGLEVGCDHWAIPLEVDRWMQSEVNPASECGVVSIDALAEQMRWCYDNQEAAARLGQRAGRWLRHNQTWDQSANQLVALLNSERG